jgi:hypothetical protein
MIQSSDLRSVFLPLVCVAFTACGDSKTPVKQPDGGVSDRDASASDAGQTTSAENSTTMDVNPCSEVLTRCRGQDDATGLGNFCLRVASDGEPTACEAVATECAVHCSGDVVTSSDAGQLDVDQCKAMGDACHDFDTGNGLGNLCHEVGHMGNLAWCEAIYADCVALCGEPEPHEEDAGEQMHLDLSFAAKVNNQDFDCGREYSDIGLSHSTIVPKDLRFFVSNVRLIDAHGEQVKAAIDNAAPYQGGGVALLDFADGTGTCVDGDTTTNAVVRVTVPAGDYAGVAFSVSVPQDQNHLDPVTRPQPLESGDMSWGWFAGYKFLKLELQTSTSAQELVDASASANVEAGLDATTNLDAGRPDASFVDVGSLEVNADGGDTAAPMTSAVSFVSVHIGSMGCSDVAPDAGDQSSSIQCRNANRNDVVLPEFDVVEDVVVFDLAQFLATSDLSEAIACHPVGEGCQSIFDAFGINYETGAALDTHPAFRVE